MRSNKFVYHSSKKQGLKVLKPSVSTHEKRWVYATKDIPTSALFIGDNWDFICQIGASNDKPYVYEQFKGALDVAYKNQSGSIYKLDGRNFHSGKTGWSTELISEHPEKVLEEVVIDDVLVFLLQLEADGKLVIFRFPNKPEGAPQKKEDIVRKAIEWTTRYGGTRYIDTVRKYHTEVIDQVLEGINKAKQA